MLTETVSWIAGLAWQSRRFEGRSAHWCRSSQHQNNLDLKGLSYNRQHLIFVMEGSPMESALVLGWIFWLLSTIAYVEVAPSGMSRSRKLVVWRYLTPHRVGSLMCLNLSQSFCLMVRKSALESFLVLTGAFLVLRWWRSLPNLLESRSRMASMSTGSCSRSRELAFLAALWVMLGGRIFSTSSLSTGWEKVVAKERIPYYPGLNPELEMKAVSYKMRR